MLIEMAVREFGMEWDQSESFAGMTKSAIPPQCIIRIVNWDTGATVYIRPEAWKKFKTIKTALDPKGSIRIELEEKEAEEQEASPSDAEPDASQAGHPMEE